MADDDEPDLVNSCDITRAAASSAHLLAQVVDRPWDVPVPDLNMTVAAVVGHIVQCGMWYTVDLAAAGRELEVISPTVDIGGEQRQLIAAVEVSASLLSQTVESAAPTVRGFHPFGSPDRSGFAAMGCDEIVVHTADIAATFGIEWQPDDDVSRRVAQRLFPWAPAGWPAWDTLRWCNGRVALGDRPRLSRWRWHSAPLAEWDGVDPPFTRSHSSRDTSG